MKGYIYSLEREQNDIFYIGSSIHPAHRSQQHKTQSKYFDESINGFVHFNSFEYKMEIVEELDFKFREELYELEEYWIYQFSQWGFNLKNKTLVRRYEYFKVPNDILMLLRKYSPQINPYRPSESNALTRSLYKIIRNLKEENDNLILME